ncbi:MAG: hypothetical protein ACI86M_003754 [Saprospiraceae bacterium]|jgi:hypothetical protein
MKYLHLFSLSFLILILVACGSDVDDEVKIDGQWKLESVSGGISGGGFPFDGDMSIIVSGSDLDMFKDDELVMEADISYSIDEFNRVILKLDRSYINEQPEFLLGNGDELVATKFDGNDMLSLFELCDDCYSYIFVK